MIRYPSSHRFRIRHLGAGLAVLGVTALLASHAAGAPRRIDPLLDMVSRTCQAVVHVDPGEAHHQACDEALSASMISAGLEARPDLLDAAWQRTVIPGGRRSYTAASFDDIRARYRIACQLVGFDPQRSGLDGCVAELAAAMAVADNPQQ